jgi:hypothetical protein
MDLNAINGQRPTSLAIDIMSPNPAAPERISSREFYRSCTGTTNDRRRGQPDNRPKGSAAS